MVVFVVNERSIECKDTDTILMVKKEIIKQLNLSCNYIDITFEIETPMRILGKFNVEPGKLARPLDRHTLDKFAFKGDIPVTYEEVEGYSPDKRVPILSGGGRGRGSGRGRGRGRGRGGGIGLSSPYVPSGRSESTFDHDSLQQKMDVEPNYDIHSHDDFPSL